MIRPGVAARASENCTIAHDGGATMTDGANISLRVFLVLQLLLLPLISLPDALAAKLDCSSAGSGSNDLPRTAALAISPAGTGAHALGAGLASVA